MFVPIKRNLGWQVGQLDAIFVPISGGGLSSGIATVAKALQPGIRILLGEPRGAGLAVIRCFTGKWSEN